MQKRQSLVSVGRKRWHSTTPALYVRQGDFDLLFAAANSKVRYELVGKNPRLGSRSSGERLFPTGTGQRGKTELPIKNSSTARAH